MPLATKLKDLLKGVALSKELPRSLLSSVAVIDGGRAVDTIEGCITGGMLTCCGG